MAPSAAVFPGTRSPPKVYFVERNFLFLWVILAFSVFILISLGDSIIVVGGKIVYVVGGYSSFLGLLDHARPQVHRICGYCFRSERFAVFKTIND